MPNALLERVPQLRRVTNGPAFRRGLTIMRQHRLVNEPLRFAIGEVRGGTRAYRLAADPACYVVVRHQSGDMGVFAEIFNKPPAYEPPTEAAAILADIADQRSLRVLDLGGNVGLFAVFVRSLYPGAQITSYEPEPANFQVLARCATRNHMSAWTTVQACAMAADGTVKITPGAAAHSHVSASGVEVAGVDILPALAEYDFIKMDIEGSEWPIIFDRRWGSAMRTVSAFVLEWHARGCPSDDAREAGLQAVASAGFTSTYAPPGGDHGMIWAWRIQ